MARRSQQRNRGGAKRARKGRSSKRHRRSRVGLALALVVRTLSQICILIALGFFGTLLFQNLSGSKHFDGLKTTFETLKTRFLDDDVPEPPKVSTRKVLHIPASEPLAQNAVQRNKAQRVKLQSRADAPVDQKYGQESIEVRRVPTRALNAKKTEHNALQGLIEEAERQIYATH